MAWCRRLLARVESQRPNHPFGYLSCRSCSCYALNTVKTGHCLSTKIEKSGIGFLQFQIIKALRLGEREKASKLLVTLANENTSLCMEHFAHMLDYCEQTPDPMFVLETYSVLAEKSIDLNKRCFIAIIQSLSKGGYFEQALSWLSYIGDNYSSTPLPIYNAFLQACGDTKSIDDAVYCLELMERRLIGKSEVTYYELLKLAVLQKNLSAVHEIWKECIHYYEPSIISLRKFIWAFTRLGDLQSAYYLLQRLIALARLEGATLGISAAGRYQTSMLDIPIPLVNSCFDEGLGWKDGETTSDLSSCGSYKKQQYIVGTSESVNKMDKAAPLMNILRWSFNDMIHACSQFDNYELAEELLDKMFILGVEPSPHTYDGYVKAVIRKKGVVRGMEMIQALEKRNIKIYNGTLAVIVVLQCKNLELDLAEALLGKFTNFKTKHVVLFNTVLAFCKVVDEPERAIRVLAKMRYLNIKLNIKTYELLFALFGNVNIPYENGTLLSRDEVTKRINAIWLDMMKSGIQHSYTSMKNLVKCYGAEGMVPEMLRYLKVAENLLRRGNPHQWTAIYNVVLHALVEAKESSTAFQKFRDMRLLDFPVNIATYNIMIECCSISGSARPADALLSMMIRDGYSPQLLTYTSLLKVLLSQNFRALPQILKQLGLDGIQPDIQLFNTVLKAAYLEGRFDVIEFVVEHIHREKILPDASTCWYTFCAYVEGGFNHTALEALQVLCMRIIAAEHDFPENKAFFEDIIYGDDEEAESKIMGLFEDNNSKEFLATALLNLRLCAIAGFTICWSPESSPWARRLASCYELSLCRQDVS